MLSSIFGSKKPDAKEVLRQETRNMKRNEREIERERSCVCLHARDPRSCVLCFARRCGEQVFVVAGNVCWPCVSEFSDWALFLVPIGAYGIVPKPNSWIARQPPPDWRCNAKSKS